MTCARIALAWPFLLMMSAYAQAQTDFSATSVKVDAVMQPKQPADALKECANDPVCSSIIGGAATYLGVPSTLVSGALAIVPKAERAGEEGHYTIEVPQGYVYCRASIRTVSVVPATGDRASVMSATSNDSGVAVYTWTPKQGLGQGRSWVEANYTIYGVKSDLAEKYRAEGKCKPPGKNLINCRGATGVNHGMPSCGSVDD
jgi:hypothetical protein